MATNWTIRELLRALRTEHVTYADLGCGDIIVDALGCPFEIADIQRQGDLLEFSDVDDNGFTRGPDYRVQRVVRQALKSFECG